MSIGQDIIDVLRRKKKIVLVNTKKKKIESLSKPYVEPEHTYKNLVCTMGFGHSGSGVIIDLLSEFDNTSVFGYRDKNGGSPLSTDKSIDNMEVDIVRRYGGVFDLEKAFTYKNMYSYIHIMNFLNLAGFYYKLGSKLFYNDKFMELTQKFIDDITKFKMKVEDPLVGDLAFRFKDSFAPMYKNVADPFVYNENEQERYIYALKDLTVKEYREIAREYVKSILNIINSKDFLVLDQFLSERSADFEKYHDYVGDYKQITVYRDPRDVYVTGRLINARWIPKDKEEFVKGYDGDLIKKYIETKSKYSLVVRFEDLVLDYDNTVPKILDFLGLKKENHVAPKTQFRPEYSIRNIGMYKNYEDKETIDYIEENLKEFCYYPKETER